MVDHEWGTEAGAEGDLGFHAQPDLGPGDLRGVPADEVVESLVRGKP